MVYLTFVPVVYIYIMLTALCVLCVLAPLTSHKICVTYELVHKTHCIYDTCTSVRRNISQTTPHVTRFVCCVSATAVPRPRIGQASCDIQYEHVELVRLHLYI